MILHNEICRFLVIFKKVLQFVTFCVIIQKSNKTVTKITKCLGSVFIGTKKVRVLALVLATITVLTSVIVLSIPKKSETVTVSTNNVATETEVKVEETIDPNSILKYGTKAEKLLNNAELHPILTGEEVVDKKVQEIFDEILDDSMSNYEKVQAIYVYLIDNFYYRSSYKSPTTNYASSYDEKMVGRAKGFLTTGHGTCTEFSATFMIMMRRLGFECYSIRGKIKGGEHTWTEIRLDGDLYIFDPEVDRCMAKGWHGGVCEFDYFCLSEGDKYFSYYKSKYRESNISSFQNFEREAPLVAPIPALQ